MLSSPRLLSTGPLDVHGHVQTKSIAPETAFKRLQEMAAGNQERDLEEYRVAMEREKEERVKKVQEERTR